MSGACSTTDSFDSPDSDTTASNSTTIDGTIFDSKDVDRSVMTLDPTLYTGRSAHPTINSVVELVAYERKSGGWDAFVFEPVGVLPETWEHARVDEQHVKIGDLDSADQMDALASEVAGLLGPGYEKIVAFREAVPGERSGVNRRLHWLHKKGATGYSIRRDEQGRFFVWMRRKDVGLLESLDSRRPGS